MSGMSLGIIVLVLALAGQFGIFYYAMRKGLYLGQPKGEGFAPGWVIRCPKCNRTVDAGKGGLIRVGGKGNSRRYGWCDGCKSKAWLCVEPDKSLDDPTVPGLAIRCTECNKTADARKVGLIRLGDTEDAGFYGSCSGCKKKKVWLAIEECQAPPAEEDASLAARS